MNSTAVIAAAHAIERTPAFRKRFLGGDGPGASTHPAAVEFARAALEAQLIDHAEHDARIVAVERERCAQSIERFAASADLQVASEEAQIAGAVLRNVADLLRKEGTTGAATA